MCSSPASSRSTPPVALTASPTSRESLGFAATGRDSATSGSPLAGYAVSGVSDARLSGGLAGVLGVAVVGLLMAGLVLLLRRRASRRER